MINSFMELNNTYDESEIVIIGVPYDGTTSFRPGTRFAPNEIRNNALIGYETYSPMLDKDLIDSKISDLGDIEVLHNDPKNMHDLLHLKYKEILTDNKKIATIGGEHSITGGIIKAFSEKYEDLVVIQLDAHTDLREEYLGSPYSHASVMKRVCEYINPQNVYQYGIRSGLKEEFLFAEQNVGKITTKITDLYDIIKKVQKQNVYITIDLDVLDPAFFPGTGTPEPNGITSKEMFEIINMFSQLDNIVGFDIVELSPHYDQSQISTAMAIKVFREMLLLL